MTETPRFSIVVPTFARPLPLKRCLEGIGRLESTPSSFEVIVVDDGGPTPLDALIALYADRLQIRLVRQSRGGPAAARNAGATLARGRYLAFIDDDCAPATNWLEAWQHEFDRDDRRLLGGYVENALKENPYSAASEHITQFVYGYAQTQRSAEPFFTTNNLAVAADLFRELGGFDVSIPSATAEDKEFCDRWRAGGRALFHVPSAVVYHAHALTFRRFLRQHFNYGRGILAFRLKRSPRARVRLVPERWNFYAGIVLSAGRTSLPTGRWRLMTLLVAAQLATLAGALREATTVHGSRGSTE